MSDALRGILYRRRGDKFTEEPTPQNQTNSNPPAGIQFQNPPRPTPDYELPPPGSPLSSSSSSSASEPRHKPSEEPIYRRRPPKPFEFESDPFQNAKMRKLDQSSPNSTPDSIASEAKGSSSSSKKQISIKIKAFENSANSSTSSKAKTPISKPKLEPEVEPPPKEVKPKVPGPSIDLNCKSIGFKDLIYHVGSKDYEKSDYYFDLKATFNDEEIRILPRSKRYDKDLHTFEIPTSVLLSCVFIGYEQTFHRIDLHLSKESGPSIRSSLTRIGGALNVANISNKNILRISTNPKLTQGQVEDLMRALPIGLEFTLENRAKIETPYKIIESNANSTEGGKIPEKKVQYSLISSIVPPGGKGRTRMDVFRVQVGKNKGVSNSNVEGVFQEEILLLAKTLLFKRMHYNGNMNNMNFLRVIISGEKEQVEITPFARNMFEFFEELSIKLPFSAIEDFKLHGKNRIDLSPSSSNYEQLLLGLQKMGATFNKSFPKEDIFQIIFQPVEKEEMDNIRYIFQLFQDKIE